MSGKQRDCFSFLLLLGQIYREDLKQIFPLTFPHQNYFCDPILSDD